MELLDRYLQGVKRYLPWQRQDDILAELRANLESQLEEKEAETGRSLTGAEAEAWIKQLGSPMQMAARYQKQQYLIGPGIFPVYWFVLRTALFWATIVYLLVSAVLIVVDSSGTPAVTTGAVGALVRVPAILMTTAAWVTLIFAVIEFLGMHYPGTVQGLTGWPAEWNPSTLPPVEKDSVSGKKRSSFAKAVAEAIFGFLFLIWLLLTPQHPFLIFGPGASYMQISRFQLAPVWVEFFWWMVALNVLQLAWRCIDLWSGKWQEPRTVQRMVFKAVGLIPILMLVNAPNHVLVSLKDPLDDPQRLGGTLDLVNKSLHLSLTVVCVIVGLTLLWEGGQAAVQAYRKRVAALP